MDDIVVAVEQKSHNIPILFKTDRSQSIRRLLERNLGPCAPALVAALTPLSMALSPILTGIIQPLGMKPIIDSLENISKFAVCHSPSLAQHGPVV